MLLILLTILINAIIVYRCYEVITCFSDTKKHTDMTVLVRLWR